MGERSGTSAVPRERGGVLRASVPAPRIPVLYLDLGSPYAYLAAERAERVLGIAPELRCIVLGVLFRERGWGSWAATGQREAGMADVERRARAYGLPPIAWPPDWPVNAMNAMRATIVAERDGRGRDLTLAYLRRSFVEGADLSDPDVVASTARNFGVAPDEITDPAVKQALKDRTQAAVELGVPGVPTLHHGDRLYWGDDRLDDAR
jgi:2-hydroxychromene-2-carboxylate isomerase